MADALALGASALYRAWVFKSPLGHNLTRCSCRSGARGVLLQGPGGPRGTRAVVRASIQPLQQRREAVGRLAPHAGVHVLVGGERDGRVGVSEALGDDLDRHTVGEKQGGVGLPGVGRNRTPGRGCGSGHTMAA